jgi:hypothetical protein
MTISSSTVEEMKQTRPKVSTSNAQFSNPFGKKMQQILIMKHQQQLMN